MIMIAIDNDIESYKKVIKITIEILKKAKK